MADTEYTKGYRAGYDFARVETEGRIMRLLNDTDKHLVIWDKSLKKTTNRLIHGPKCGICTAIALIKGDK
jgi:hypothetical protein